MPNATRLLLVEDDPNLGTILHEYLTLKGYEATLARDGAEGWNCFTTDQFDLCILDVMLPKMDGFALAERIRANVVAPDEGNASKASSDRSSAV